MYDLRHLFATTLLNKGADLAAVSKLMGHSTVKLTADTYYHYMVLNTIMDEKNYLITKSDDAHQRAEKNVKELNTYLDKVDAIARQYNLDSLLKQSQTAREETSKYADKYREGVKSIKDNQDAVKEMVRTGNIVGDAADKFLSMQVAAYTKAQKDGVEAATLDKYVQRYIVTTRIYELALKIMGSTSITLLKTLSILSLQN